LLVLTGALRCLENLPLKNVIWLFTRGDLNLFMLAGLLLGIAGIPSTLSKEEMLLK
jgi:hypothetical protein